MISLAITVCNEHQELETLLNYLEDRALFPEYEIVIQIDKDNYTDEVLHVIIDRGIKHWFYPLNKDFASYKNELKKHCSGEFIFQIDADELVAPEMLEALPKIIEANPEVDLYYVPRINTVSGITEEHIQTWGWSISKLPSQTGEKELDLNNPKDLDEYNLLKKYNLIIEENEIQKKIKYYLPIINWSDYQTRIYRNTPDIKWKNAVHEIIEGHKHFTVLPAVDELALIHPKTIEKQEKQNQFYSTI